MPSCSCHVPASSASSKGKASPSRRTWPGRSSPVCHHERGAGKRQWSRMCWANHREAAEGVQAQDAVRQVVAWGRAPANSVEVLLATAEHARPDWPWQFAWTTLPGMRSSRVDSLPAHCMHHATQPMSQTLLRCTISPTPSAAPPKPSDEALQQFGRESKPWEAFRGCQAPLVLLVASAEWLGADSRNCDHG